MKRKNGDINDYIKNELNGDGGRLVHDIGEARELYKNVKKIHNKKCYVCRIRKILKNINKKSGNL